MSFTYSSKELQELEKMLEKKLFDLKVAQSSAKSPPSAFDELSLTTNILKFVQYLVNRELSNMGFWRQSPLSDPPFSYGANSYPNISSIDSVVTTTSTICENCRQKNPTHTHCVHRMACGDFEDCNFGTVADVTKAASVPKKES